jgi:ABC-type microcin C transport system permease subunit YejE
MDLIQQRLPNTLAVVGVAYVIGIILAIPIGMISAVKRYSLFDHFATTFAFVGFSVPTFFTGLLLIILFSINLRWFPFIYDSTLQIHDIGSFMDQVKQSIMPITVLALFDTATIARYTRAEMLEHLPLDYVRTARSKGLHERVVVLRHVLRNSLIPVVTLVALGIPAVFGGAIDHVQDQRPAGRRDDPPAALALEGRVVAVPPPPARDGRARDPPPADRVHPAGAAAVPHAARHHRLHPDDQGTIGRTPIRHR